MINRVVKLPLEQEAIRAKCFHPTGKFVEFTKKELEQSIPERFEKIVADYPEGLAVKDGAETKAHLGKHPSRELHCLSTASE